LNEINKLLEFQVRILKILWIIELRYIRIVCLSIPFLFENIEC